MKNFTLFALAVTVSSINHINAQWTTQTTGFNSGIKDIQCMDKNTCYIFGADGSLGHFSKTTDGQNWVDIKSNIPDGYYFTHMQVIDKNTVYGSGGTSLAFFRTTNGGTSWEMHTTDLESQPGIFHFIDKNIGIGSIADLMIKTTDGGKIWDTLNSNSGFFSAGVITFLNESVGFLVGQVTFTSGKSNIYKTTDGGQTFKKVYDININTAVKDIYFPSAKVGYACGINGLLLKSTDFGETWQPLTHPLGGLISLNKIDFISENHGYIVCNQSKVIKTNDGGLTWTEENYTVGTQNFSGVDVIDNQTVYIASGNSIGLVAKNTNAGLTAGLGEYANQIVANVYPNPSISDVTIELQIPSKDIRIELVDFVGKVVLSENLISDKTTINRGNLQTGTYIYQIIEQDRLIGTGKIIFN